MAIVVGSVAVDVVPSVQNFSKNVRAKLLPQASKLGDEIGKKLADRIKATLDVELKKLPNIQVGLDTTKLAADIEKIKARLDKLGASETTPKVKPEIIGQDRLDALRIDLGELAERAYSPEIKIRSGRANADILAIRARLERLNAELAKPEISMAGGARIEAEIAKLTVQLDEFGAKHVTAKASVDTKDSERGIRRLFDLAIGLAPVLTTVGIVGAGAAVALGASFATAASGIGLFALAARGAFALLKKDEQTLKQDEAKLATARIAVDNAKGPKQRAAALKQEHIANLIVLADLKAMGPAEGKLANTTDKLSMEWKTWLRGTAIPGLNVLLTPLRTQFPKILKDLTPLFNAVVVALSHLEKGAFKALASPFWQNFFKFLAKNAGPTIESFGRIIGNIVKGFARLIQAFAPTSAGILGGLEKMSNKFANFSTGPGSKFQHFLNYIHDNGPAVAQLVKSIGRFFGELAKALGNVGGTEIKQISAFLDALTRFANAHPKIAEYAVAIFTLSRAIKALKLLVIGGWIKNLAGIAISLAAVATGSGKLLSVGRFLRGVKVGGEGVAAGKIAASVGGGAAAGEGAALFGGASLASIAATATPIIAAIALPLAAAYLLHHFVPQTKTPPGVPDAALPNRGDNRHTTVDPRAGTQSLEAYRQNHPADGGIVGYYKSGKPIRVYVTGSNRDGQDHPTPPRPDSRDQGGLPNSGSGRYSPYGGLTPGGKGYNPQLKFPGGPPAIPPNISTKVAILGVDTARRVLKVLGIDINHIPTKKETKVATTGAREASLALINVQRALKGLPPLKHLPITTPGANASALAILNVNRAARGLPPLKKLPVSSPGAKNSSIEIRNLNRAANGLPPIKRINTSAPGGKISTLTLINLSRAAHGLPPIKKIPTSTPGAVGAHLELINLNRAAHGLPPLKRIPTNAPGATTATLQMINLDRKARGLPPLKKIPTNAPGIDPTILRFINLDRKARGLPPLKKIPVSAPGADHTTSQIQGIHDKLGNIKPEYKVALKVIGSLSDAFKGFSFARGGKVKGAAGVDVIPAMLTANEYVQPTHVVAREGVAAMDDLRAGRATIVPKPKGYAQGGVVINTTDPGVPGIPHGIGQILSQSAGKVVKDANAAIQKFLSSFGGGGGGGAGAWLGVVKEALALLHQPLGLAGLFLRVIAGESGGNPRAINLYDSNAKAGHPSVGLAQVIRGTFDAYAGPFRNVGPFLAGVSVNPLANVFAGLNYGIHTYGSVANIPGIASELHGGGYRPYRRGGRVSAGTPILVGEDGPEIFQPGSNGNVVPNSALGDVNMLVKVYVGDREITDITRTEVTRQNNAQGRAIVSGRRVVR